MIKSGYAPKNESMKNSQSYFRVEKYNNIIIKVITDPKSHWISSNLKKALDNLQKQKKIDGYLSSPGRYEVHHDGNLSPNKLVDILVDYVGDGDRVADEYRPNDIIKVML